MSDFHRDVEINSKGRGHSSSHCVSMQSWALQRADTGSPLSLLWPAAVTKDATATWGYCQVCFQKCVACKPTLVLLHLHLLLTWHTGHSHDCFLWWCRKITKDSSQQTKDISEVFRKICTSHLWLLRWSTERRRFVRPVLDSSLHMQWFTIRRCLFLSMTIKEA